MSEGQPSTVAAQAVEQLGSGVEARSCPRCGARGQPEHSAPQADGASAQDCRVCRCIDMDPFNAVSLPEGLLHWAYDVRCCQFRLELPHLAEWREQGGMRVEVRMTRVSAPKTVHVWPTALQTYANGLALFDIDPPDEGHKRRDVPQEIGAALRSGSNSIAVMGTGSDLEDYLLVVVLCTPCGIDELRLQIARCGYTAAVDRMKSLLDHQAVPDEEQAEELECLSADVLQLTCPITMEKVAEPVRGKACKHLRCFELEAYISMNHRMAAFNNRWVCPICSLILQPRDLCLDEFLSTVISQTHEEEEEVLVHSNGSWSSKGSATTATTRQPESPKTKNAVLELLDDSPPPRSAAVACTNAIVARSPATKRPALFAAPQLSGRPRAFKRVVGTKACEVPAAEPPATEDSMPLDQLIEDSSVSRHLHASTCTAGSGLSVNQAADDDSDGDDAPISSLTQHTMSMIASKLSSATVSTKALCCDSRDLGRQSVLSAMILEDDDV
eukprot:TRINITY_DN74176_c0_g1_i1.p1 TRINITY_DN74176_c0_g1~~TRINITY_DN74176_c0_g1_i1.p1  ORF type:complete len:499 (+),score=90.63 TRINITY_DN74176_c0_g1_i1:59-1555(+)